MTRRLERQDPYWYQQGKELVEQDMKDPTRANVAGVYPGHNPYKKQPMLQGRHQKTVAAGATDFILVHDATRAVSIQVQPGASGTALVEFTSDDRATVVAGTATWEAWTPGAASADTTVRFERQFTALRMTTATADGVWMVLEV